MYKVVIADDEHMIKKSLAKMINEAGLGFQVVGEAEDGREALELVTALQPSLLITDISMPVMDGLELITELKQGTAPMETIVISGYDDFDYVQHALRHGVSDYLLKPIKPEQVIRMLERVAAKWQAEQQAARTRSDCLPVCRSLAVELAERLWTLNEEGIASGLEAVHRQAAELAGSSYQPGPFYFDLLSFLKEELVRLSGGGIVPSDVPVSHREEPPVPETAPEHAQAGLIDAFVLQTAEAIRQSRNWGYQKTISRGVQFLQERFADEHLTLQTVAEYVDMSPSYFSRVFKELVGVGFIQYLIHLRLEKAKELLGDPGAKTYEVAFKVGYGDYPHFAKAFKKRFGLSPSEYKKKMN
ncbi:response regulator transcription factor [Paenibacillus rigui]|uniref:DNA-binding response regulator n=1 Tax=Paenibacillus rigui TaxID=554312 RepID=A0A229UJX9_9BACL|nr:response regulator [Paenibacillus rigui]OXM83615.1 hypothetical protein CF651_24625 [Paenibacillus rigui]